MKLTLTHNIAHPHCSFPDYCYRLPLEVMTLHPVCESVETAEGVPLYVTGVSQIKVMKDPDFIGRAVEQFLGKTTTEIGSIVLQTLEGHLRAILGKSIDYHTVDNSRTRTDLYKSIKRISVRGWILMNSCIVVFNKGFLDRLVIKKCFSLFTFNCYIPKSGYSLN